MRQFYTAPTLVRSLEAQDDKHVTDHDRSSLRILGTVGEPINPRAWMWFFEVSVCPPAATLLHPSECMRRATLAEGRMVLSLQLRSHGTCWRSRCRNLLGEGERLRQVS